MLDFIALILAMGCVLVAGVFYAFSTFVMRGLDQAGPASAIAGMQGINRAVFTAWFMLPFLGLAPALAALAIAAWLQADSIDPLLVSLATGCYLFGTVLLTGLGNVPLNEELTKIDPNNPTSTTTWTRYLRHWTRLNHLRTAMAIAAASMLVMA